MNKPIKAKNLPLFSIIDLDQLRRENHLEGTEVTDFFTARDGKVYLLMEQPSETQGKDWLSTPSTYTAVEIQLDWAEQRVLETTLFPLGLLKFQFHYLRPAGDHFLLLGARCAYRESGPDQNAWIVSRDGAVLSRFCLGDGIQDCVVKKDGTIITSYFDEGVFGNYGWDEPLGACGLIAWTSEGTPLWKNEKYSIYDCYRDAIARYLYLGQREKALQTAERLATSRLWAVAGPTQVRPMSFFEDPNLREFLLEPESLRRIREAAFIDDGSLIRK